MPENDINNLGSHEQAYYDKLNPLQKELVAEIKLRGFSFMGHHYYHYTTGILRVNEISTVGALMDISFEYGKQAKIVEVKNVLGIVDPRM